MEKMASFTKLLKLELDKLDSLIYDELKGRNYFYLARDAKVCLKNDKYIELEGIEEEDTLEYITIYDCGEYISLSDYEEDYRDTYCDEDEESNLEGVLVCNSFLYEVLYYHGELGYKFKSDILNEETKKLLKNLYKIAGVYHLDLIFEEGCIYLVKEDEKLYQQSFACETMKEIDAMYYLKKEIDEMYYLKTKESLKNVMKHSDMTYVEFAEFYTRFKQHKLKQASLMENKE